MAESKIRDENYYQVSGWMLNCLRLKGVALQLYAIIYGFSQDGEGSFTGSVQYLCDFTNATRPTVIKSLKDLVERGYLLKTESRENGVKFCSYKADLEVVKKLYWGSKEILPGGSKETLPRGSKEILPNNKSSFDNKPSDNKGDKKKAPPVVDFSETNFSEAMQAMVNKWLQYKTERKDEYTPTGLQSLIAQIQKNVNEYGEKAVCDLIEECIARGWQGIIFDRLKPKEAPQQGRSGRTEMVPEWMENNFQPTSERIKKNADWLDQFLDGRKKEDPAKKAEIAARAEKLRQEFAKPKGEESNDGSKAG